MDIARTSGLEYGHTGHGHTVMVRPCLWSSNSAIPQYHALMGGLAHDGAMVLQWFGDSMVMIMVVAAAAVMTSRLPSFNRHHACVLGASQVSGIV